MSLMKKKLLLAALFAASVAATLAFVNNIFVIVSWWRSFIAAGGNSAAMAPHRGCMPFFDRLAVDYSAVTTFIPMLGFWCMTAGLVRIVRRRRVKVEDFPFFRGSDQLNVALGLFGTLWGIIVIGYFDLATVSMADLMQCLHTALFSTLTAVVWVFMIDRPIVRPLFARMLSRSGLAETGDDDLAAAVERLVSRLGAASDEFDDRIRRYEEASACRQKAYEENFRNSLRAYEESLEARHRAYCGKFDELLKDCAESFEKRRKDYAEAFEKRQKDYAEAFEKRLSEYENEFDARQKEYVEVFLRRIAELENSALREKARADASNAKLAAVTEALR